VEASTLLARWAGSMLTELHLGTGTGGLHAWHSYPFHHKQIRGEAKGRAESTEVRRNGWQATPYTGIEAPWRQIACLRNILYLT